MWPDAQSILDAAPVAEGFFDGFEERVIEVADAHVFLRMKGEGVPLVLLHGYPQSSAMWHKIAPELAKTYRVICPDLRGYGRSGKPETTVDHAPYSKRAMAGDILAALEQLGVGRFMIGAHDRGARVAHRMAADYPERVMALSTLDIAPTREMYAHGGPDFARAYWHWFWLIQPAPFPETLIGQDPTGFWCWKCCRAAGGPETFAKQALAEYLEAFADGGVIHGACEDYRAAYSIDITHDDAETAKLPMPLLALWGRDGVIEAQFDCLALWRKRAADVRGWALPGGHYLPEQVPQEVLAAWLPFFAEHRSR